MTEYSAALLLHRDAMPERDMVPDVRSCCFRFGIIPGCVLIALPVHLEAVVMRNSLPWTHGPRAALPEVLPPDRLRWKVDVPFYVLASLTLRQNLSIPNSSH